MDESDQEGQTTSKEPERADIWPLTLGTLREHRLANSARDPSHPAVLRVSAADEWLTGIVLTRRWVTGIGPVSRTLSGDAACHRARSTSERPLGPVRLPDTSPERYSGPAANPRIRRTLIG